MRAAENDQGIELVRARWGLTPAWLTDLSKTPAHARAETVVEQPMFRDAFAHRRCLLPANGFYEWRGTVRKRPFWLTPGEGAALFFAAIWEAYPVQGHTYLSGGRGHPGRCDPAPTVDSGRPGPAAPQTTLRERPLANLVNDPKLNAPECLTPLS